MPHRLGIAMAMAALVATQAAACAPLGRTPLRFTLEDVRPSYRAGEPVMLAWRLTNTSRAPVQVLAEMETPGRADFDAVTVRIRPLGRATAEADPITLMGKRTAVRKVLEVLTPGTALTRAFDLAMFAGYYGIRLEPGKYRVDATYDAGATGVLSEAERARSFTGRLFAPAVTITIGR